MDILEIPDRMRDGVHGMMVFGLDSDAWLKAETFSWRAGVGIFLSAESAILHAVKSIYYRRFLVSGEVCR
jgi:hypothetical protein